MAKFASDEIRPVKAVFYDDLDTVRFGDGLTGDERKARTVTAMGNIMGSMLVGNIALLLSQPQSFDNRLLLEIISPNDNPDGREDRLAFLRLTRSGFVQVGLMKGVIGDGSSAAEGYTLINAFRAALANHAFVFSGWPELNYSPDLRSEVLGCLDRAPGGRMSTAVPAEVAARVEGLREFDQNLRQSPNGIRVVNPATGDRLETRVNDMLQTMAPESYAVRDAAAVLAARAQRDKISLDIRSNWYRLIDWNAHQPDSAPASALHVLRDIVDLNYNAIVNETLGDDGMSLSAGQKEAADTAAKNFTPGRSPGEIWADLTPTPGKGGWLRWSDVPGLLEKLQVLSADGRLTELEKNQGERIIRYQEEHSWGVSIKIAFLPAAGSAVIAASGTLATGVGPGQAVSAGAITGVATLLASTPAGRALKARNMAKKEERLRLRDERSAIRAGEARWLERIRSRS